MIRETVSVVLRRQVPVRFDEPPRSWLGGLPMMPEDVPWPVGPSREHPEHGETPLHFIAQIACADLPAELWGGLGPREGWLLLFVNAQEFEFDDNPNAVQLLHIDRLGPERDPPAGIQPHRDEIYTGYGFDFYRSQADIPPIYRRWPVDIVTVPNTPIAGQSYVTITPENFSVILYDGQSVAADRRDGRPTGEILDWPFTWRGALYVIDSAIRSLNKRLSKPTQKSRLDEVSAPGWIEQVLTDIEASLEDRKQILAKRLAESPADARAVEQRDSAVESLKQNITRLETIKAYLTNDGRPITGESLRANLEESRLKYEQWLSTRMPELERIRAEILGHALDSILSPDEFRPIYVALMDDCCQYWEVIHGVVRKRAVPAPIELKLADFAAHGFAAAIREIAADLYVSSPEHRSLIPERLLERLEPCWRTLTDNRPHRMGGLHDGVQSTADDGPKSEVFLFQIASDDAMQWCWGDLGAIYVTLEVGALTRGDFSRLRAWEESH
jgi:hypothetical protein